MKGFISINLIMILALTCLLTGILINITLHDKVILSLKSDYIKARYLAESGMCQVKKEFNQSCNEFINEEYDNYFNSSYSYLTLKKRINDGLLSKLNEISYNNPFPYKKPHKYIVHAYKSIAHNYFEIESIGIYNNVQSKIQILVKELDIIDKNENKLEMILPEILQYKLIY